MSLDNERLMSMIVDRVSRLRRAGKIPRLAGSQIGVLVEHTNPMCDMPRGGDCICDPPVITITGVTIGD